MKLLNYRCVKCDTEKEVWPDEEVGVCEECGGELEEWNFKNNKQRVFIQDPMR